MLSPSAPHRVVIVFLARNRRERLISLVSLASEEEGLEQLAALSEEASSDRR